MQSFATTHRTRVAGADVIAGSADSARSLAQLATILAAALVVAFVIGWVVAASLGLGAAGNTHIGPDRPPPPMVVPDDSWPNSFALKPATKEDLP